MQILVVECPPTNKNYFSLSRLVTTVNHKGVFCVVVIASLHLSAIYPSADDPCFICLSNLFLTIMLMFVFINFLCFPVFFLFV